MMKLHHIIITGIFLLWIPVTAFAVETGLAPAGTAELYSLGITFDEAGTKMDTETDPGIFDISVPEQIGSEHQAVFHPGIAADKLNGDTGIVLFREDNKPEGESFSLLPVAGLTDSNRSDASNTSYMTFMILLSVGILGLVGIRRKRS